MSKVLGKAQILDASDLHKELVEVPEWGGSVWVRGLSGAERKEYMSSLVEFDGKGKVRGKIGESELILAFLSMCDESGERLFAGKDDLEALGRKSAQALRRVTDVAERLSGLGADAVEQAEGN